MSNYIGIKKEKYIEEPPPSLKVIPVDHTLYTPPERRGIAFVDQTTNRVVTPRKFTDLLKLKAQMHKP